MQHKCCYCFSSFQWISPICAWSPNFILSKYHSYSVHEIKAVTCLSNSKTRFMLSKINIIIVQKSTSVSRIIGIFNLFKETHKVWEKRFFNVVLGFFRVSQRCSFLVPFFTGYCFMKFVNSILLGLKKDEIL